MFALYYEHSHVGVIKLLWVVARARYCKSQLRSLLLSFINGQTAHAYRVTRGSSWMIRVAHCTGRASPPQQK